ncbi:hypothetical protein CEXT_239361 [Caerostris extrusa]|uniref:Uncharacterized protein n=1 Tax=Caerostris extrusa TaxID=172846 RepID=A0AAV4PRX6_CAEEX|nr:hypothetical protein CEXT_239361 [Caerostris extrusa]
MRLLCCASHYNSRDVPLVSSWLSTSSAGSAHSWRSFGGGWASTYKVLKKIYLKSRDIHRFATDIEKVGREGISTRIFPHCRIFSAKQ